MLLSHHIEQSQEIRGGRAYLSGTRITVDDIVIMHQRLGLSVEQIVGKYKLEPAAVHAALAYYYDHKAELDQLIVADDAYVAAFKLQHPSLLQQRLQAIGSE